MYLKNIVEFHRPRIVASQATRGSVGAILDVRDTKTKSICIPHGTVTKYYDIYGKLYNKAISDTLFYNGKLTIISQSNLANSFKNKFGFKNKFIDIGNLIFASPSLISLKRKKILYAVTNRDFKNSHFYGIESFYEFYDNLITLNNLAKTENLDIVVKPHSSEYKSIKLLEKKFTHLTFSTEKISKALKFCFVTVSFSSTVIEDSLNSKIPVILFDRWKRYKHCDSETNPYKKNSARYKLWKKYYSGASGLMGLRIKSKNKSSVKSFINSLKLFGYGFSWGGFESLALYQNQKQLGARSYTNLKKDEHIIRLHIGLEDPSDIINDLKQALKKIK